MNFGPKGGSWDRAIAWASQYPQLKGSVPRQVFAIGAHKPEFHREVGMDPAYIVATTECAFEGHRQACHAWFGGASRGADLHWLRIFYVSYAWFSFVCE